MWCKIVVSIAELVGLVPLGDVGPGVEQGLGAVLVVQSMNQKTLLLF
jgi:hypothetical protein